MNRKSQLVGLLILRLLWAILLIGLILYFLLVAYPYGNECENKCRANKPNGETLIESEVAIFSDLCHCYYSSSTKNYRVR